jgi:hypothetical protein
VLGGPLAAEEEERKMLSPVLCWPLLGWELKEVRCWCWRTA